MTPGSSAVSAERTICETTSETRLTGVARKRAITSRSRSLTIAIPLQVAPKKAFMTTIARREELDVGRRAEPPPQVASRA